MRLKDYFRPYSLITSIVQKEVEQQIDRLRYDIVRKINLDSYLRKKDYLTGLTLQEKSSGISTDNGNDKLVVSLTSYGHRISNVYLAIESIMQGSMKPNRIILWLDEKTNPDSLPITLKKQQERGLEILYCQDLLSYKKLIPTLCHCNDSCIITIDDDVIYEYDLVENLYNSYKKYPKAISGTRVRLISFDSKGKIDSYNKWDFQNMYNPSHLNFATGVGGILYPPNIFTPEVFNNEVFMGLCKYGDDIWFKAMELLANVPVVKAYTHSKYDCDFIDILEDSEEGLCVKNTSEFECRNDIQIQNVFKKYNLLDFLYEYSKQHK